MINTQTAHVVYAHHAQCSIGEIFFKFAGKKDHVANFANDRRIRKISDTIMNYEELFDEVAYCVDGRFCVFR